MTYFYCTGCTGAVFKHNGFNTNTKKETIIRDHALLNADEDDEMVSINKRLNQYIQL